MRVRTLTVGIAPDEIFKKGTIERISNLLHENKERIEEDDIEVQTIRISTDLWSDPSVSPEDVMEKVTLLESSARLHRIDLISIGPARNEEQIGMVPRIIEGSSITCSSSLVATREDGVLHGNVLASAKAVKDISRIAKDGSKNFMFASIACCPPDTPFFPASYHSEGTPSMTIGLENGDLVWRASERASGLREAGKMLTHIYQEEIDRLLELVGDDPAFKGIDLSLAPGLGPEESIGNAVEKMTGSPFGSMGTLSACSELTRSVRNLNAPSCGYSGLMLPVLEDVGLGCGADNRSYTVQGLLLYSSVCGTGLDAVPLPGSSMTSDLASTILDMASLSSKWNKPLSARLMPIPDKDAGEMTDLNSPYLKDCSILEL
ncbi:MAG: DUF711 family protein [Candidatus Thermoplasmatota archaeon]|nr:DUF711 family protein [Candidatus Thermoplasmatota archaeon]